MTFDTKIIQNYEQDKSVKDKDNVNNNNNNDNSTPSPKPTQPEPESNPNPNPDTKAFDFKVIGAQPLPFINQNTKSNSSFYQRILETISKGEVSSAIIMLRNGNVDITKDGNRLIKIALRLKNTELLSFLLSEYRLRYLIRAPTIFEYNHNFALLKILLKDVYNQDYRDPKLTDDERHFYKSIGEFKLEAIREKHQRFCVSHYSDFLKCQCTKNDWSINSTDKDNDSKDKINVEDKNEDTDEKELHPSATPDSDSDTDTDNTNTTPNHTFTPEVSKGNSKKEETEVTDAQEKIIAKPPLKLSIRHKNCQGFVKDVLGERELFNTSCTPLTGRCQESGFCTNSSGKGNGRIHGRTSFDIIWTNDMDLISELSCGEKDFVKVPDTKNTYAVDFTCFDAGESWDYYLVKFPQEYFSDERRRGPNASCLIGLIDLRGYDKCRGKNPVDMKRMNKGVKGLELVAKVFLIMALIFMYNIAPPTWLAFGDGMDVYKDIYPNIQEARRNLFFDISLPSLTSSYTKVDVYKLKKEIEDLKKQMEDMGKFKNEYYYQNPQLPPCLRPFLSVGPDLMPHASFSALPCDFDSPSILKSCHVKEGEEYRIAMEGECVVMEDNELEWF